MKSPVTGKEMILSSEITELSFRKEQFTVSHHFYLCPDSGQRFEDEILTDLNLNQVYNQYRQRYHLPFPEEITALRNTYDLSAAAMSAVLGFGINVYRSYENGEIPSSSNARLIQLACDPREFRKLVQLSNDLSNKERERLLNITDRLILNNDRAGLDLQEYLMGVRTADELTGFRLPNLVKFSEMVIWFAHHQQPWKTKLNKLLFFADFLHFKKTGYSISGSRYRAIEMGPVPANFNSIFEHLDQKELVSIDYQTFPDGSVGERFRPVSQRSANESVFDSSELATLRQVAKNFEHVTLQNIISVSHSTEAWKSNYVNGKKLISYFNAFRNEFF